MKRQQKFIAGLGLIVALSGQSSVMAADAKLPAVITRDGQSQESHPSTPYKLSQEQLDGVHAGMDWTGVGAFLSGALRNKAIDDLVDLGYVVICDDGGACKW